MRFSALLIALSEIVQRTFAYGFDILQAGIGVEKRLILALLLLQARFILLALLFLGGSTARCSAVSSVKLAQRLAGLAQFAVGAPVTFAGKGIATDLLPVASLQQEFSVAGCRRSFRNRRQDDCAEYKLKGSWQRHSSGDNVRRQLRTPKNPGAAAEEGHQIVQRGNGDVAGMP